jgi:1-acyl-sn-glycerol-3-phosphate acyltransferase
MNTRAPEVNILLHYLARGILRLIRWDMEGALPDLPKMVLIAVPHTTNWDGLLLFLAMPYFRVRLRWMGKASLFWPPLGWLLRALGGIPIDRKAPQGAVRQLVVAFDRSERLALLITPEGTRKQVTRWKSGFYYIAQQAGVPVLLVYVDHARHTVGIGPAFNPSGDLEADLAQIQAFYIDKVGEISQGQAVSSAP